MRYANSEGDKIRRGILTLREELAIPPLRSDANEDPKSPEKGAFKAVLSIYSGNVLTVTIDWLNYVPIAT